MKIKTVFTPKDLNGSDVNFKNLFTLQDLAKLGKDLIAAGIAPDDALDFSIDEMGFLTITTFKIVDNA